MVSIVFDMSYRINVALCEMQRSLITMLDIGKSLRKAMADRNMRAGEVAAKAAITVDRVYQIRQTKFSASCDVLDRLAFALDMKVSELIALGESDVRTTDDSADSSSPPSA
jgi:DNA-binding Xre family transcriptional regulator